MCIRDSSKPGALVLLHSILGHEESDFVDKIKDGPEPNLPDIKVETVTAVKDHIKFSQNLKVIGAQLEELE